MIDKNALKQMSIVSKSYEKIAQKYADNEWAELTVMAWVKKDGTKLLVDELKVFKRATNILSNYKRWWEFWK